ncbi:hypothetical protein NSP_4680 [Nodularia spumigena CCY9414]|nr:hypothetical protein NSP_4680 [Nodularia spumigena CCY9414]
MCTLWEAIKSVKSYQLTVIKGWGGVLVSHSTENRYMSFQSSVNAEMLRK